MKSQAATASVLTQHNWPEHFPAPIPPVRVLDNLIWFDWLAVYREDFREYVCPTMTAAFTA